MGFVEKLKLLFKVQKPLGTAISAFRDAKQTKKWFHFAVTLVGILGTAALALNGVIPPQADVIAVSILTGLYNIVRGADKASDTEIKGTFRTTEFWLSALTEVQKVFVTLQTGGVSADWVASGTAIVGGLLAFGQNLAARAPIANQPDAVVTK